MTITHSHSHTLTLTPTSLVSCLAIAGVCSHGYMKCHLRLLGHQEGTGLQGRRGSWDPRKTCSQACLGEWGDGENETRCSSRPPKDSPKRYLKEPAHSNQALGKGEVDTHKCRCCSPDHLLERAARLGFPACRQRKKEETLKSRFNSTR